MEKLFDRINTRIENFLDDVFNTDILVLGNVERVGTGVAFLIRMLFFPMLYGFVMSMICFHHVGALQVLSTGLIFGTLFFQVNSFEHRKRVAKFRKEEAKRVGLINRIQNNDNPYFSSKFTQEELDFISNDPMCMIEVARHIKQDDIITKPQRTGKQKA